MKKKLLDFKKDVSDAKAAWNKARKDNKVDEAKSLRAIYEGKLALLEGFEADGKKDADEIELPDPNKDANIIQLSELTKTISDSVRAAFDAQLPELLKSQVTEESIKAIVEKAIKDARLDEKKLTPEAVKAVVDASITEQMKAINLPSKFKHAAGDANKGNQAEIGCSLRKGNLPLHMKQLANVLLRKPQNEGIDQSDLDKGAQYDDTLFIGMATHGVKALTTSGDGTGAEWIPRTLTSELYRRLYLDSALAQAFMAQEVQMPTDPYDYPLLTTDPVFKLNNVENRDAEASDPGTAKITLTSQTLMALCQFSYKADEDSIVPLLPMFQQTLARAAARALENALINGDTTATHQDSDITNVNDQAKAWKGFRKLSLAVATLKSDLTTGGLTRANLLGLVKLLGKWGVRSQDLLWIVGAKGWTTLLGLDEVALAYARGGPSTYNSGGPTPAPWGGQIVVSEQGREDLNASGVYDGTTTTKGSILVLNKSGFILGSRREFLVEVDKNIRSQTHDVVASFRKAFTPVEVPAATTAQTVAIGYNYAA